MSESTSKPDGIAGLKAMSTTAGLTAPGVDSYRAVNPFAVASVVCGLLTLAGLLHRVFLVLPILGVLLAIVAIIQIVRSRQTQAGFLLALLGLVLSIGLGSWLIQQEVAAAGLKKQYISELQTFASVFGRQIAADDTEVAYAMMSEGFRQNVDYVTFDRFFDSLRGSETTRFGKLTHASTNELVEISLAADPRAAGARGIITFHLDKDGEENLIKQIVYLVRQPGGGPNGEDIWKITSFEEWFQ